MVPAALFNPIKAPKFNLWPWRDGPRKGLTQSELLLPVWQERGKKWKEVKFPIVHTPASWIRKCLLVCYLFSSVGGCILLFLFLLTKQVTIKRLERMIINKNPCIFWTVFSQISISKSSTIRSIQVFEANRLFSQETRKKNNDLNHIKRGEAKLLTPFFFFWWGWDGNRGWLS